MTDISLYERINRTALKEVLNCNNIPYNKNKDSKDDILIRNNILKRYQKKVFTKRGIQITYNQPNKYGRYISKGGLQLFKKEVRKYISGDTLIDLDFENCAPNIIKQLLIKNQIVAGEFLEEYTNNRSEAFKKYKIKDKLEVIVMLYGERTPYNNHFKELHKTIYNTLIDGVLLKQKPNKTLLARTKKMRVKKKEDDNHIGAFFSHYIQEIESKMLDSFYRFCISKNVEVNALCFDGLMISNESFTVTQEFLDEAQHYIKEQTGYSIIIKEKSNITTWKPIQKDKTDLVKENQRYYNYNIDQIYQECKDGDGKFIVSEFIELGIKGYLNKHICKIDTPHCYGWKLYSEDKKYNFITEEKLKQKIGKNLLDLYKKYDIYTINYDTITFDPTEKSDAKKVLNTYVRPQMNKDLSISIFDRCPLWFSFLKETIFRGDDSYKYSTHYISKLIKTGKTNQALLFQGMMGTGKSAISDLLGKLIGEDYYEVTSNILSLQTKFNSQLEKCILMNVEEVPLYSGNYRIVNEIVKEFVTGKNMRIELKGVDSYKVKSFVNLLFNSNNASFLKIPEANRRFWVGLVSSFRMNDYDFFEMLYDEITENVEYLRYYYYSFNEVGMLNSIRPTTEAEINMRNMTQDPVEVFIKTLDQNTKYIDEELYETYRIFLSDNEYNCKTTMKLFKSQLGINNYHSYRSKNKEKENITLIKYKKV